MQQGSPGADRARRTVRVSARSAVAPSAQASGPAPELRAVIDAMPEAVLVCDPGDRVRIVNPAADRLFAGRPVQDVLDLSEEPILLQRVVESAIRVARGRTPDVQIETSGVTDPPAISGDAVYVDQVVRNLVTAATRFGGPGAPVLISLETGDGEVSLEVIDRGPNLSPMEIQTSFALTDDGGLRVTGLGVARFVCRRLVEAMHGRVWVRVPDGGGAAFGFALPCYQSD
jgi:signal transduction histidine kinase